MTLAQKTGRVFLLTATLVIASILSAMLGALVLFVAERSGKIRQLPGFSDGLFIILVGFAVNFACVFVLLQIKKADNKLMPPDK